MNRKRVEQIAALGGIGFVLLEGIGQGFIQVGGMEPEFGAPYIQAVTQRLRVPEIVTLSRYDRVPASSVTSTKRSSPLSVISWCLLQPSVQGRSSSVTSSLV